MNGILFGIAAFLIAIGIIIAAIKGLSNNENITSFWSGSILGGSTLSIILIEIGIILLLVAVIIQGR